MPDVNLFVTKIPGGCSIGDINRTPQEHNAIKSEDINSLGGLLSIPYYYNGLKVLEIGQFAFSHCTSIIHVHINAEITLIRSFAFVYCSNLQSVNIPASVEKLGHSAFGLGVFYSSTNTPPSNGTINIYIESNSKLRYIDTHGICCKSTINIYFCGSQNVESNTLGVVDYDDISIYSHTQLTFAEHQTSVSSFSCITQQYPRCTQKKMVNIHMHFIKMLILFIK